MFKLLKGISCIFILFLSTRVSAEVFQVKSQFLTTALVYAGTLEPVQQQKLESVAKGTLQLSAQPYGRRVTKGDILWEIESLELESRLREIQSLQLEAEQRWQGLLHWADRPELQQARQQVRRAQTNLNRLKNRADQTEKLFKAGIVSRDERDQESHAFLDAEEWLEDAETTLTQLQKHSQEKSLKIARLQYENLTKQVALLEHKKKQLTVIAPFDGLLLPPPLLENQSQAPLLVKGSKVLEDQVLGILVLEGAYQVDLLVDEKEVAALVAGMPATIQSQSMPELVLKGVISNVYFYPHPLVQVLVEPILDSIKDSIHYGMKVSVVLEAGGNDAVLSIPKSALSFEKEGVVVHVKRKKSWVSQPIDIGRRSTDFVEVTEGLKEGDEIENPYSLK